MIKITGFTMLLGTFLVLFALNILIRSLLHSLNIKHLLSFGHQVPKEFMDMIDEKTLKGMRDYTVATDRLVSLEHLTNDILILLILLSGFLPWLAKTISGFHMHFVISGITFFFACSLIMSIVEIPFDLYKNFVVEKKFSFSTITLRIWLSDLFKSFTVSGILMGIFFSVFLGLVYYVPATWWLWVWVFFILFQLLITWLYPVVIAPLFNKFEPIEDKDLKKRISSLAGRTGISVKGLFKMDAGKRSRHSNAYFTGIGKAKRIVLFDTLVDAHTPEEISAVLAHELGHWKKGHVKKQLLLSTGLSLVVLYLAYMFVTQMLLYETFGFDEIVIYAGLFILAIIAKPLSFFLTPLSCMLSRHFEKQADDYAYKLLGSSDSLVDALKHLARQNLANLHPHPLFAWFYYSHPPLVDRVKRLRRMK